MTPSDSLASALKRYELALNQLEVLQPPTESAVVAVLTSRDILQTALNQAETVEELLQLQVFKLDQRLRNQGDAIAASIPLADWRESFNRPESAWWWKFPQPPDPRDRFDWLWSGLTIAVMTANFALVMNISSKFLTGGLDLFGSLAVVGQSVLTLLAGGGAFTQTGRQGVETVLQQLGVSKFRWNETKFGMSTGLLLLLVGFHASLPQIAKLYTQHGAEQRETGEVSGAEGNLKRAIQLNPDNAQAHYNLGQVYATTQRTEQAETQLQIAAEDGVEQAFVALAQLYNRQEKPKQAIATLRELEAARQSGQTDSPSSENQSSAVPQSFNNSNLAYSYHVNLGWALFQQQRWGDATTELKAAIQASPNRAAPYCLLAQTLEKQGKSSTSLWENCRTLANNNPSEEDRWIDF